MVLALNTVSGQIADIAPKFLQHSELKNVLVVVDEDSKSYEPELYKGGTKDEKNFLRNGKQKNTSPEVDDIKEEI
jgi:hypothetical protein